MVANRSQVDHLTRISVISRLSSISINRIVTLQSQVGCKSVTKHCRSVWGQPQVKYGAPALIVGAWGPSVMPIDLRMTCWYCMNNVGHPDQRCKCSLATWRQRFHDCLRNQEIQNCTICPRVLDWSHFSVPRAQSKLWSHPSLNGSLTLSLLRLGCPPYVSAN